MEPFHEKFLEIEDMQKRYYTWSSYYSLFFLNLREIVMSEIQGLKRCNRRNPLLCTYHYFFTQRSQGFVLILLNASI